MKDSWQWPLAIDGRGRRQFLGNGSEADNRAGAETCVRPYVRAASAFSVGRGHRHFAPFSTALAQGGVPDRHASTREHFDAARGNVNIALWKAYLPEDCVSAMIKNGWHLTV